MAEMEIKRVNFFDGQFLKEEEFIAFDAYHLHMRRRWAFVMFDKSGVIQATPNDLTLTVIDPATKRIGVNAGMAIGKRPELAEAKEIVVRTDAEVVLTDPQWGLAAGDTAIFTVHYEEKPVAVPPSEGDVPGDTRIEEHAVITVHKNAVGAPLASGEPYVRLGDVDFDSLAIDSSKRAVAYLNGGLVAVASPSPQISLTPNTGVAGGSAVVVAVTATNIDLSTVTDLDVTVSGAGVAHSVTNATQTTLTLTLTIAGAAAAGARTVTITVGGQSATATFTVLAGLQLTGFTGVDEPEENTDLVIHGSGFDAGQSATVVFPPGVGISILGGNVLADQIVIPMASIPDEATAGIVTVTNGGNSATLNVTPPPKVLSVPLNVLQNGLLTLGGKRLLGATVYLVDASANTALSESTFSDPGEVISAEELKVKLTSIVTPGDYEIRVETLGGTVIVGNLDVQAP